MLVITTQRETVDVIDNEMLFYTIGSCAFSSLSPTVRLLCHWPRATSTWPQSSWCELRQTAPLPALLKRIPSRFILKNTRISSNYISYLLTPWRRVLREKLMNSQLFKKFPIFYGTRRFITAFTSARHLSISSAISIQTMPHPTSLRSILIWSSHLRLGLKSGLFP